MANSPVPAFETLRKATEIERSKLVEFTPERYPNATVRVAILVLEDALDEIERLQSEAQVRLDTAVTEYAAGLQVENERLQHVVREAQKAVEMLEDAGHHLPELRGALNALEGGGNG